MNFIHILIHRLYVTDQSTFDAGTHVLRMGCTFRKVPTLVVGGLLFLLSYFLFSFRKTKTARPARYKRKTLYCLSNCWCCLSDKMMFLTHSYYKYTPELSALHPHHHADEKWHLAIVQTGLTLVLNNRQHATQNSVFGYLERKARFSTSLPNYLFNHIFLVVRETTTLTYDFVEF
jgi:hypothetical protein